MALLQPQTLINQWLPGGYRIRRFIGAGAFAWVYYATTPDGDPVAIKVLQNATPEATVLFTREIKVLRQLPPSPYCVRYLDDGLTDEGAPFLAMEFVDGATLKDAFKFKPRWEPEEACHLMLQLCDALAGLHQLGVAHRDIKPENIMLTREWEVKLMDFGLVKDAQGLLKLFEAEDILTGRDFAENVDKAMLAGTPEYMAPEQFSDPMVEDETQAITDTWTDVYSLGLIFYQVLTGSKLFPFAADNSNQAAYARSLLKYIRERSGFEDYRLKRPEVVPAGLWPVLARSLRMDPRQRQRTAAELAGDIERYLEAGEVEAFTEAERTSIADMGQLLAALNSSQSSGAGGGGSGGGARVPRPNAGGGATGHGGHAGAASSSGRSPSKRPPPRGPRVHVPDAPDTDQIAMPAPPVDVARVQSYRDERLNAPGGPRYTLPPGMLNAKDFLPQSIVPAPPSSGPGDDEPLPLVKPASMHPGALRTGPHPPVGYGGDASAPYGAQPGEAWGMGPMGAASEPVAMPPAAPPRKPGVVFYVVAILIAVASGVGAFVLAR